MPLPRVRVLNGGRWRGYSNGGNFRYNHGAGRPSGRLPPRNPQMNRAPNGGSVLARLGNFAVNHPCATACAAGSGKLLAADLCAQTMLERRDKVDWRRAALMAGLGVLQGWKLDRLYNGLLPSMVQHFSGWSKVAASVAVDLGFFTPMIIYPSFYAAKEAVMQKSLGAAGQGVRRYENDFMQVWTQTCVVFIPAQVICFGLVPPHLRCPFTTAIGAAYYSILG